MKEGTGKNYIYIINMLIYYIIYIIYGRYCMY